LGVKLDVLIASAMSAALTSATLMSVLEGLSILPGGDDAPRLFAVFTVQKGH